MQFTVKVDPLGEAFESKKTPGFFIRQCLIPDGNGGRRVVMIGSKNLGLLSSLKTNSELALKFPGDFCFAV